MALSEVNRENRFRLLAEQIQDGLFVMDVDRRFSFANEAFERLVNRPSSGIIGKETHDVFPEDHGFIARNLDAAFAGISASGINTFTFSCGGSDLECRLAAIDLQAQSITSVMGLLRKTENIHSVDDEAALGIDLYHNLFDKVPTGFALHEMIFDDDGRPIDYRFISINPAFEELTGLSSEAVIGKRITDILPKVEKYWLESYGDVVKNKIPHRFSNYSRDLDRHYDVTAFCPFPGHFACLFNDITDRKRTEDQLRSNSEFNDKIILESPIGMIVYDGSTGKCLTCNDAAVKVVGGSREQMLALNFRDLESWKRSGLLACAEEALAKGIKTHHEALVASTFGKDLSIECHFAPVNIGNRNLLLVTVTDISERVEVQKIIELERDLGLILSKTSDMDGMLSSCLETTIEMAKMDAGGIYLVDSESGDINLVAHKGLDNQFVNLVTSYRGDSPQAELIRKGKPTYTHFSELALSDPKFSGSEDLGAILILPICHNDQAVGCLNLASHSLDEVPVIARAMIESLATHIGGAVVRIQTEQALHDSEAKFRSYVESAPDGIIVVDENCCPIEINAAAQEAFGYSLHELAGKSLLDLAPPEFQLQASGAFDALRATGFMKTELPLRRKDGRLGTFSISAVTLVKDRILLFAKDTTDRVEMEGELRQAERMQAIGQLAGGIAHDFNNQLAGIMGFADLLRQELRDNEKLLTYTEAILSAADRSATLTSQLLAFSRKGKFFNTSVNLHDTISNVVLLLERSIDKKVTILQNLKARTPITTGDPTQLHNAFLNLGINASDAMPGGGNLSFSTDIVTLSDEFCKGFDGNPKAGTYVKIEVSDTGIGMNDTTRARAFEPFFTTKEQGKGTGMGLAAVYGAVKSHGGIITLHSKVESGTLVTVYLPQTGDSIEDLSATVTEEKAVRGTARILLIDDDLGVQSAGEKLLAGLGYSVTVCQNGLEGLNYFRDHWQDIDLVLLDMNMPEMSGEEAFSAMLEINPDVVVLILSGYYSLDEKAQRMIDTGAKGFIQKPFRRKTLSNVIEDILRCQS